MRSTTHPDDEVLAAIALGEPDVDPDQLRHVEECDRCAQERDELLRTIRVVSFASEPGTERPGAGVWNAVVAEIHADALDDGDHPADRMPSRAPVTELRRRRPPAAVLLLAAACLVVGAVVGRVLAPSTEEPGPSASTPVAVQLATTELDTVRGGEAVGTATVSRTGPQTAITLSLPPVDPRDGYLEVWLLDRELDKMVSVGVVGDSQTPTFSIPSRLLAEGYVVLDVSREDFDGGPEHSGDSVVRGTFDT